MIVSFKYHLHDGYDHDEMVAYIAQQAGVTIDDELADKIGRPFYEVELDCTLNTDTGTVVVTHFEGRPIN